MLNTQAGDVVLVFDPIPLSNIHVYCYALPLSFVTGRTSVLFLFVSLTMLAFFLTTTLFAFSTVSSPPSIASTYVRRRDLSWVGKTEKFSHERSAGQQNRRKSDYFQLGVVNNSSRKSVMIQMLCWSIIMSCRTTAGSFYTIRDVK
jgi:hypothetical protein